MKNHKRLLVSQCKYTKTPMSKFECFGHAVKGQCYTRVRVRVKELGGFSDIQEICALASILSVFKTIHY